MCKNAWGPWLQEVLKYNKEKKLADGKGICEGNCVAKKLLFGWLTKTRPAVGLQLCWKDCVTADLKILGVNMPWYEAAQNHRE